MTTKPLSYKDSPLQLIVFNDCEDELFGALNTPERLEYENKARGSKPLPVLEANPDKTAENKLESFPDRCSVAFQFERLQLAVFLLHTFESCLLIAPFSTPTLLSLPPLARND